MIGFQGMLGDLGRDREFSIAIDFSKFSIVIEKSLSRQRIHGPRVSHVVT